MSCGALLIYGTGAGVASRVPSIAAQSRDRHQIQDYRILRTIGLTSAQPLVFCVHIPGISFSWQWGLCRAGSENSFPLCLVLYNSRACSCAAHT